MSTLHVSDSSFEKEVLKSSTPVLVDFYADWCGPCKMMTPVLETLASEMAGKLAIYKLDVDNAQKVAAKFDITSVPTLILFENGEMKKKIVGLKDLQTLKSLVS